MADWQKSARDFYHDIIVPWQWWVFVILLTFGQLQRFEIGNIALYGFELWAFSWWLLSEKRTLTIPNLNNWKMLSSLLIIILSYATGAFLDQPVLLGIAYLLRTVTYIVFAVWCVKQVRVENIVLGIVFWLSNVAVIGLAQWLFLPDTRFLQWYGWDDHFYRVISTQFDPNFTGLLLVVGILMSLALGKKYNWKIRFQPSQQHFDLQKWWFVPTGLMSFALLGTFSRSSFVAVILSLIWYFTQQKHSIKKRYFLGLAMFALSVLGISSFMLHQQFGGAGTDLSRLFSATGRVQYDLAILQDNTFAEWIFGKGIFTPHQLITHGKHANNIIVTVIAGFGLGGVLALLFIWKKNLIEFWQKQAVLQQSIWVAVLVHSMFNHSLFQNFVWMLVLLATLLPSDTETII